LREQMTVLEIETVCDKVISAAKEGEDDSRRFTLTTEGGSTFLARTVLLSTVVVDLMPPIPCVKRAVQLALLRICAVCDAYEIQQHHSVALIGRGAGALPAFCARARSTSRI